MLSMKTAKILKALDLANAARAKLGAEPGTAPRDIEQPPGCPWATYWRARARIEKYDRQAGDLLLDGLRSRRARAPKK